MNSNKPTNVQLVVTAPDLGGFITATTTSTAGKITGIIVITTWVCTECFPTEWLSRNGQETPQPCRDALEALALKIQTLNKAVVSEILAALGAELSAVKELSVGRDCEADSQSGYCTGSEPLFYLTSVVYAEKLHEKTIRHRTFIDKSLNQIRQPSRRSIRLALRRPRLALSMTNTY